MSTGAQTPIPFLDLPAQHASLGAALDAALGRVLGSCRFVGGPEVAAFEAALARAAGAAHCVGVANGTDALQLVLRAAGIGPGDEVVVPANTFLATAEAVALAGARPVLADCREDTLLLDPEAAAAAITPRTRALIPVHLYGLRADLSPFHGLASRHGLALVEDACQAHGAALDGRWPPDRGSLAAAYSFYPGKNLGALGDAGAVLTDDAGLAAAVRRLGDHGRAGHAEHVVAGTNSRLDALQAAVLAVKLERLGPWNERRAALARRYDRALRGLEGLRAAPTAPGRPHVYHLYVVRSGRREALEAHLAAHGVATGRHYPVPLHLQPAWAHLGHRAGEFPVAEAAAQRILSLPLYPELAEAALDRVAALVREVHGAAMAQGRGRPLATG